MIDFEASFCIHVVDVNSDRASKEGVLLDRTGIRNLRRRPTLRLVSEWLVGCENVLHVFSVLTF